MADRLNIAVLGSTGSIGVNTLSVIAQQQSNFQVFALSANTNTEKLFKQCLQFEPRYAVVNDPDSAVRLDNLIQQSSLSTQVLQGDKALSAMASHECVDTVMAGIVGAAGLPSTLAGIEAGKRVMIANKEPIVMLGDLIIDKARESGAKILPVDSEHNAIMQCMPSDFDVVENQCDHHVERILLTGSGGPFRTTPLDQFESITVQQACQHPNWDMGQKISIDSATMMNKALELIEACVLFSMDVSKIEILIHPQSIIHSMVEYIDGSVIAQLGTPDMRIAIASALAWPQRTISGAEKLNFLNLPALEFEEPDEHRYPSLKLVKEVLYQGGTAPCVMNAANEVAVEAFVKQIIGFTDILNLVQATLESCDIDSHVDLETVIHADQLSRSTAKDLLKRYSD